MALTQAYQNSVIAKAQRKIAALGYSIAEKELHGEEPDSLYRIRLYISHGCKVLTENNQ